MPRRFIFSTNEINNLLSIPDTQDDLIHHYTFSKEDLSIIRQLHSDSNRLGFAIQLCYIRYPGLLLGSDETPPPHLLRFVADQMNISVDAWSNYGKRGQTRREHLVKIQSVFNFKTFTVSHRKPAVESILETAKQTDKGIDLAATMVQRLRNKSILLPTVKVIKDLCAEAITRAGRDIYQGLTERLSDEHRKRLDALLELKPFTRMTTMMWLRQPPGPSNAKHILEHINRLKALRSLQLPEGIEKTIQEDRLFKMAREGAKMTPKDLSVFESKRRYATLVAIALDAEITVTDQIIKLNEHILGIMFSRAKRHHEEQFTELNKDKNNLFRLFFQIIAALLKAKTTGSDPYAAIERVIPLDQLIQKMTGAEKLITPDYHDYTYRVIDSYSQIRRYSPAFLELLQFKAMPVAVLEEILVAVDILKALNAGTLHEIPSNAPTRFIPQNWKNLVLNNGKIDRRYYELCVLVQLKDSLNSGDIWVQGSRQFKSLKDYLLSEEKFAQLKKDDELPISVTTNCNEYLNDRLTLLDKELRVVELLAKTGALPDATITEAGLKITPLDNSVPDEVEAFTRQVTSHLPYVKITDIMQEVDEWTNFSDKFIHLKTNETTRNKTQLLTAILADAINLGLSKMSVACPGASYHELSWLQSWYIRDETYKGALAKIINAHYRQPFTRHWGDGTTSSSDGQRFRVGSHAKSIGRINPKYGSDPGMSFYTHISDQYSPFHTNIINVGERDATYVLDGLLCHESVLLLWMHYTDTAGYTDHQFALMYLLGYYFAPRIRNLGDIKLFIPDRRNTYPALNVLLGDAINKPLITRYWDEILRLVTSIKQGTVSASLMLKKLGGYPRQNGLAMALKEVGRIERTLFILKYLQDVQLRRRIHAGLNKGEARNALARAVFFNRMGEIRDRNFENQNYRASGLNLVTAAIILWNTVYIDRVVKSMKASGRSVNKDLLQNLSPINWDHINLTGDYIWPSKYLLKGKFRDLRPFSTP